MTKMELDFKTTEVIETTREALQMVYDALNHGQQQKLLKNEDVAALFAWYGVSID